MPHFEEEEFAGSGPVEEIAGARTHSYQRGYPYLEISGASGKETVQLASQNDIAQALGAAMG